MKTNDPLEDFIRSNREAFDDMEVPAESWNKVSHELKLSKPTSWWNNVIIWRAAAILFMATSIYLMVPIGKPISESNKTALKELDDVESFYSSQITKKVALIQELSGEEVEDDFIQDFKQLEAMYTVLKEEMKTRPSKKVKDALVLNLLVRINLLNQQLSRLEASEKREPTSTDI